MGCKQTKEKKDLIRIAAYEGEVAVDFTGKAKGRGVYLCPDTECFNKAKKSRSIARGLNVEVSEKTMDKIREELENYERKS